MSPSQAFVEREERLVGLRVLSQLARDAVGRHREMCGDQVRLEQLLIAQRLVDDELLPAAREESTSVR